MTQWFQNKEQYTVEDPVPEEFKQYDTLSLVRVNPSGKTQSGWAMQDFVENQAAGMFKPRVALKQYQQFKQPFAFVMRGIPYMCTDVDGKNGGIETAQILRLHPTRAEISKSGNGFHLFYKIPLAQWDELKGYAEIEDHNGVVPGVDIRGTGAVFHFPGQRWNNLPFADIPASLFGLLTKAQEVRQATRMTRSVGAGLSDDELVIQHDRLASQLAMPAKQGGRNQRLFAIGCQMYASNYPNWEAAIRKRGEEVGLDEAEMNSIVKNIQIYA